MNIQNISIKKKFLYSFIAVFLFFAVLELLLRIFVNTNTNINEFDNKVSLIQNKGNLLQMKQIEDRAYLTLQKVANRQKEVLNKEGFRDKDCNENAGLKILSLGDSTSFGFGVEREDSFPAVLEKMLSERFQNRFPTGIEVYNAGIPSTVLYHGLFFYCNHFQQKAQWDYVIINFGLNESIYLNVNDMDVNFTLKNSPSTMTFLNWIRKIFGNFRIYNFIEYLVLEGKFGKDFDKLINVQYKKCYRDFVSVVRKNNSTPIILLPMLPKSGLTKWYAKRILYFRSFLKKFAKEQNVVFFDFQPEFNKEKESKIWIDECHFNEKAHEYIAKNICHFIIQDILNKHNDS